jgi:hypothetical protein
MRGLVKGSDKLPVRSVASQKGSIMSKREIGKQSPQRAEDVAKGPVTIGIDWEISSVHIVCSIR